jgi:RNA polymerase sigma-70 factor (ECF subfamily)
MRNPAARQDGTGSGTVPAAGRPHEAEFIALMVRYQAGDLDAFEELYRRLMPRLKAVIVRYRPAGDSIDDLVQDTFLQIHRARHTYDARYPVTPWAAAIARHVTLMARRAASRRPQATDPLSEAMRPVAPAADRLADRATLGAALAGLPASRRQPLVWHHVLGLSFREVAQRLGIGTDAAKLRSSRAMAALRARLAPLRARHGDD